MDQRKEIPQLDGLRFFAALIVFVSHFSNATGIFNYRLGQGAGQIGVMLFFLLSSFLMGWLYLPVKINRSEILKFMRRRMARVLPLYLFCVILFWWSYISFGTSSPTNLVRNDTLVEHLLLYKGTGEFWTIPVEIHYYLLFIILWTIYYYSKGLVIVLSVTFIITIAYFDIPTFINEPFLIRYIHYFLAGFLCAILAIHLSIKINNEWANTVFVGTLISIPFIYPRVRESITGIKIEIWSTEFTMIVLVIFFLSCIYSSFAYRVFGNIIMRYLGNLSYAFYLIHVPIINILSYFQNIKNSFILHFFASFIISLIISSLLYHKFEYPVRIYLRDKN